MIPLCYYVLVPGTPSWTAKLDDVEKEQQDKDVIYMFSPDHP